MSTTRTKDGQGDTIMRALILERIRHLHVRQVPVPQPGMGEVLIRTACTGISSTDHRVYHGTAVTAAACLPVILGHENCGTVVATGNQVDTVVAGDRVAVNPNIPCHRCEYCRSGRSELCCHLSAIGVSRNGGMAEYFSVPAETVYRLPDQVELLEATAIDPLSCALHGIRLLDLRPNQRALIIGDGFMAQLFAQILQIRGLYQVDMVGLDEEKLNKGKQLSNLHAVYRSNKRNCAPPQNHYDLVIEAVGAPNTQTKAMKACRRGAQVLLFGVGIPDARLTMNAYDVYQKELTIRGSFINPCSFGDAISLLASGRLNIAGLITHRLDLAQVPSLMNGSIGGVIKAAVTFEQSSPTVAVS